MKLTACFVLLCFVSSGFTQTNSLSSRIDSSLASKITISGLCLCQTTLSQLKTLDPDIQEVAVEEMDMCKDGFAQDVRFINNKGYASKKYPGMIFQKDIDGDQISKIRLTKDFSGSLPDGTAIDVRNLTVKDALSIYPKFNTWKSRGCSDYWNLTNDTLAFFVKIDKNRKPQYPVDEAYYQDKPIEGIDLVVSCYSIFSSVVNRYKQLLTDPVFFIDSVNVTRIEIQQYKPEQFATVSVYKEANAISLVGEQGKYGAVYIETKEFARNRYQRYFKSKSIAYANAFSSLKDEKIVAYILNGKVLSKNFEGDLSMIDDTTFIDLQVIDNTSLKGQYKITDKKWGIVIRTKTEK